MCARETEGRSLLCPPPSDVACQRRGDSAEQKTGRLAALADWLASVAALGSKVSVQP